MSRKRSLKITDKELNKLTQKETRDLNLCATFYYECMSQNGILKSPNPKQMLNFIKQYHHNEPSS